jgi:hypothetical protein
MNSGKETPLRRRCTFGKAEVEGRLVYGDELRGRGGMGRERLYRSSDDAVTLCMSLASRTKWPEALTVAVNEPICRRRHAH